MTKLTFVKSHWPKILSIFLFVLLIGSYSNIFAIGEPYDPGETLDPECPPGEINCTVLITSGGGMVYPDTGIPTSTSSAWGTSITSSSGLATNISDEVGTGYLVLNDSPSFTTRITTPLILGGTGTTQDLSFQTTSGVGATGADMHFLVGNNGATEAMTLLNNGNVGVGTNSPTKKLTVVSTDFDVASFRRTTSGGGGTINFINGNNQTWGFGSGGNFNEFFISDRDSLTFPFRIEETTPNNSFYIKNNGNIGIGTGTPASKLEIKLNSTITYTQTFSGSGLDDATFSGTYTGSSSNIFYVTITEEGSPDTFDFIDQKGECVEQGSTLITGSPQFLCDGIYITFNSTTGHTYSTSWNYNIANNFIEAGPAFRINDNFDNYFVINAVARDSNFIGLNAGYQATSAINSNFFGVNAGRSATSASDSNFLGQYSGDHATNANNSNFFGQYSGYTATNANNSNFLGQQAGYTATNANNSNFFGYRSGMLASSAQYSNFIGSSAGYGSPNARYSNFLGSSAGWGASSAQYSNFIGQGAGYQATNASNSNFMGNSAGSYATYANNSNFIGTLAGEYSTQSNNSNFIGTEAGFGFHWQASGSTNANFIGYRAGQYTINASYSNFIGNYAGNGASYASNSNFIGNGAGANSGTDENNGLFVSDSNFIGTSAGSGVTNANYSNFIGYSSGSNSLSAYYSNFLGYNSGLNAPNASNSIFIGQEAGSGDYVDNTSNFDDFSILIGKSTNTGGFSNSIAIGGSATNTASNEFMIGSATRPINTTIWTGASGTATLDTATGLITTSDERLKKNIIDLEDTTLDKLINVRTVKYNWINGNSDKTNIGFLAQDLENYFPELVYTGTDGYKGVNYANMTPIIVQAIREMDLKVNDLYSLDTNSDKSFGYLIKKFIEDESNFFSKIFAKTVVTDGIEMKDSATGEQYCVVITNGEFKNIKGKCGEPIDEEEFVIEEEKIIDEDIKEGEDIIIVEDSVNDGNIEKEGVIEDGLVEDTTIIPVDKEEDIQTENEEIIY